MLVVGRGAAVKVKVVNSGAQFSAMVQLADGLLAQVNSGGVEIVDYQITVCILRELRIWWKP